MSLSRSVVDKLMKTKDWQHILPFTEPKEYTLGQPESGSLFWITRVLSSGENFRFLPFAGIGRVVCDHIYISDSYYYYFFRYIVVAVATEDSAGWLT
jgi:hypothetical protein